jgi:hypothetical protein
MIPSYTDPHRFALNDLPGPVFGAWLLVQGLIGGAPLSIAFGLAAVGFMLFKRHKRYDLFQDALVIRYLVPRPEMVVYLRDIEAVQLARQPIVGIVVVIQRKQGPNLVIRPGDPNEMESRLNAALSA